MPYNDEETTTPTDSPEWLQLVRRQARLLHIGTVRITDGQISRTFLNDWVPEGQEVVIDTRSGI